MKHLLFLFLPCFAPSLAAWAAVDGKRYVLTAGPKMGFALIEFPKNQK
jgi:hypothetical protein